MLDFNSRHGFSNRVNYLVDAAIAAQTEEPRRYLGASSIGHECERAVQFELLAAMDEVEKPQPGPRIRRIFDRGNVYEKRARRWLKDAGFIFGFINCKKDDKGNLIFNYFEDFDGIHKGHADGVVTGWKGKDDCPIALPALWECKCLADKYWRKLRDEGLKKYSQTYYWQAQIYMHYLGLDRCLYTAVNANDLEVLHLLVEIDPDAVRMARSRVERVINATKLGELVPRCTADPNYYICKSMCDFRAACWK